MTDGDIWFNSVVMRISKSTFKVARSWRRCCLFAEYLQSALDRSAWNPIPGRGAEQSSCPLHWAAAAIDMKGNARGATARNGDQNRNLESDRFLRRTTRHCAWAGLTHSVGHAELVTLVFYWWSLESLQTKIGGSINFFSNSKEWSKSRLV